MEVPVRVGGLAVDSAGQAAVLLSGHLNIKKRNVAITFLFHGELDAAVKPVEVFQKELEVVLPVLPDDESIVHISEPNFGSVV